MKRNLLLLICVLAVAIGCLASCQTCEHTFSENWASDAASHWHPATCEHGEIKSEQADHVDADENGFCDVCEYEVGHTHGLEADWTYDETHHWKNSTCTHTDYKGEHDLHSDEDMNGSCDLCTGHVHNVNAAGYCKFDDCNKKVKDIDESDLEALVYAINAQQKYANGGNMSVIFDGRSNHTTGGFATHSERAVSYLFGNKGYTYNKTTETVSSDGGSSITSTIESWTCPDGAENTFGVYTDDGGRTIQLDSSDPAKLLGFYLALSTLADGHGPDELLISLYEISRGEGEDSTRITVSNLVINADPDNNKLSFSYSAFILQETFSSLGDEDVTYYNANHYDVAVELTYTDLYVLTSFKASVDAYTNDPGALPDGQLNELDIDLDYDPVSDTYTFRNTALADSYTIELTQTVGERTEENPHPKDRYVPTDFDLFLEINEATGELSNKLTGGTISANVNQVINLYVGDCFPRGTSTHFAPELVTFKLFKNGVELESPEDYTNETAVAMFTFAGEQRLFFVIPKTDGAYRLEVYLSGEKLHEVNINAGLVEDEHIQLKDNEFAVRISETYEWANEVVFTAERSGTYYFNVPAKIGFMDADKYDASVIPGGSYDNDYEAPAPYLDYNNLKNLDGTYRSGSFSLTLEAGQTVRFYVNGMSKGTYIISYSVL